MFFGNVDTQNLYQAQGLRKDLLEKARDQVEWLSYNEQTMIFNLIEVAKFAPSLQEALANTRNQIS